MMRILRGIPSLQRKFIYIVFASGFVFLVYLLTFHNDRHATSGGDISLERNTKLDLLNLITKAAGDNNGIKPPISINIQTQKDTRHDPDPQKNPGHGVMDLDYGDLQEEIDPHEPAKTPKPAPPTQKIFKKPPNISKDGGGTDPYSGPQNDRQQAVVDAFMHAWNAYKKYAWGHDELKPISHGWQEWFGVGLTIVDSLDTMYIMGLKDEFELGHRWVAANLTFDRDSDVQLFEIVIRELGGLLSAYHLSGHKVFAEKALELGNNLFPCFSGPTKVPCNRINLKRDRPSFIEISTAESGTIQLEFRDLARVTDDFRFEKAIEDVSLHIHNLEKLDGLVACFLSGMTGMFRQSSTVSMGASADSYYEYLVKQWIQTGKSKDWLKNDYLEAMEGMKKHLLKYSQPSNLAFVGALHSMQSKGFRSEMEHLACFLPGTLALGHMHGLGNGEHLKIAEELTRTCYEMYKRMPTGLSPEVALMNMKGGTEDISVSYGAQYNLQRPETVESIFYMYRATKDEKYREWGWEIFQAFEKYTKLEEGYASIDSVRRPENPGYRDKMETFYLAETLKYLYLLFSDDPNLLPLDKFVINTEAHPLPVYER